jgi:hypothetical protein
MATKQKLTADETCPVTGKLHVPDPAAVSIERDGEHVYLDVCCKDCGRSGCIGRFHISETQW